LNPSFEIQYISNNNFIGKIVQTLFRIPVYIIALILTLSISSLQIGTFAQSNLKIFEEPGGGGSGNSQTDDSNSNTAIYVVGGLLVAGIIVYALVFKKDKKADTDTTASLNSNLIYSDANNFNSAEELQKVKDKIPVDFFLGIRNNEAILNDRIYQVGLRVKL
jgi:hypothetical protein